MTSEFGLAHDLDVSVAKAAGMWDDKRHVLLHNRKIYSGATPLGPRVDGVTTTLPPAKDWNVLIAAVAKLREKGYCFELRHSAIGKTWTVWSDSGVHAERIHEAPFLTHINDTEALALARCIAAVVGQTKIETYPRSALAAMTPFIPDFRLRILATRAGLTVRSLWDTCHRSGRSGRE